MKTLTIDGTSMPCRSVQETDRVVFIVEYPLVQAVNTFVDNADITVEFEDGFVKDYTEYSLADEICYMGNGTLKVAYRKLTDIEKLIELHYGGAN